jgi:hypothetical protein
MFHQWHNLGLHLGTGEGRPQPGVGRDDFVRQSGILRVAGNGLYPIDSAVGTTAKRGTGHGKQAEQLPTLHLASVRDLGPTAHPRVRRRQLTYSTCGSRETQILRGIRTEHMHQRPNQPCIRPPDHTPLKLAQIVAVERAESPPTRIRIQVLVDPGRDLRLRHLLPGAYGRCHLLPSRTKLFVSRQPHTSRATFDGYATGHHKAPVLGMIRRSVPAKVKYTASVSLGTRLLNLRRRG